VKKYWGFGLFFCLVVLAFFAGIYLTKNNKCGVFTLNGKKIGCDFSLVSKDGLITQYVVRIKSLENINNQTYLVVRRQKNDRWMVEKYPLPPSGYKFSLDKQYDSNVNLIQDQKVEYKPITSDEFGKVFKQFIDREVILLVLSDGVITNIKYVEVDSN